MRKTSPYVTRLDLALNSGAPPGHRKEELKRGLDTGRPPPPTQPSHWAPKCCGKRERSPPLCSATPPPLARYGIGGGSRETRIPKSTISAGDPGGGAYSTQRHFTRTRSEVRTTPSLPQDDGVPRSTPDGDTSTHPSLISSGCQGVEPHCLPVYSICSSIDRISTGPRLPQTRPAPPFPEQQAGFPSLYP